MAVDSDAAHDSGAAAPVSPTGMESLVSPSGVPTSAGVPVAEATEVAAVTASGMAAALMRFLGSRSAPRGSAAAVEDSAGPMIASEGGLRLLLWGQLMLVGVILVRTCAPKPAGSRSGAPIGLIGERGACVSVA